MTPQMTQSNAIRISIRILGKSTSVSLRKNIVSLWLLMKGITDNPYSVKLDTHKFDTELNTFIYDSADIWEKKGNTTAKGFSDFIGQRMIEEFLEEEDFRTFCKIHQNL